MVRRGSTTSSPSVAIRAYPANAKKSRPADCSTPPGSTPVEVRGRCRAARQRRHDDHGERREREHDDHEADPGRPLDAAVAQRGDGDDREDPDEPRVPGCGVGGERERHRRAARGLADDERPARLEPPERSEPSVRVDVGAARLRVQRREPRRRRRVAERHHRGDQEPDQQARARRLRRGREHGEHPGAEHGAEPDDHRVRDAEATDQGGHRRHGGHAQLVEEGEDPAADLVADRAHRVDALARPGPRAPSPRSACPGSTGTRRRSPSSPRRRTPARPRW